MVCIRARLTSAATTRTIERHRMQDQRHYAALIRGAPVDSVLTAYTENRELIASP